MQLEDPARQAANYYAYGYRKLWLALKRAGEDLSRLTRSRPRVLAGALEGQPQLAIAVGVVVGCVQLEGSAPAAARPRGSRLAAAHPSCAGSRRTPTRPGSCRSARRRSGRGGNRCRRLPPFVRSASSSVAKNTEADLRISFARRNSKFSARSLRNLLALGRRRQLRPRAAIGLRLAHTLAQRLRVHPRGRGATSAIDSQLSSARRTPRRTSSSGYFFGRAITSDFLSRGSDPRSEASVKPSLPHTDAGCGTKSRGVRSTSWAHALLGLPMRVPLARLLVPLRGRIEQERAQGRPSPGRSSQKQPCLCLRRVSAAAQFEDRGSAIGRRALRGARERSPVCWGPPARSVAAALRRSDRIVPCVRSPTLGCTSTVGVVGGPGWSAPAGYGLGGARSVRQRAA